MIRTTVASLTPYGAALLLLAIAGPLQAQTWTPVAEAPRNVVAVSAEWPSGVQTIARCTREDSLDVAMTLGRPVSQAHVAVSVTLGDTDFPEQRWRLSQDGAVIFARQPLRLAWTLIDQGPASIELRPDEGPAHRYELAAPSGEAALSAVLTACGQPVSSPFVDGARITNPDWVARPSGSDLARLYPREAARNRISGSAVLECRVAVNGQVEDCIVLSEEPDGMGFGAATVALSSRFRMTPMDVQGVPYGESLIRLPMNWRMQ